MQLNFQDLKPGAGDLCKSIVFLSRGGKAKQFPDT